MLFFVHGSVCDMGLWQPAGLVRFISGAFAAVEGTSSVIGCLSMLRALAEVPGMLLHGQSITRSPALSLGETPVKRQRSPVMADGFDPQLLP